MKNKIYLIFATMVLLIFSSCENFLDVQPTTSLAPDLVLSDFQGLEQAVVGTYAPLYSTNYYGASIPILSDLAANNAKKSPIQTGRYNDFYHLTYTPSATSGLWGTAYHIILNSNNIINQIESYELNVGENQDTLDHFQAEALFLRALAHFDLTRVYCQAYTANPSGLGVPIMLEAIISEPARNTLSEVYTQIISDLTTAAPLFQDGYVRAGGTSEKAWANLDACNALLARVYLYMGDYTNAASYASKVINSAAGYSLYTDVDYASVWGTNESSEIIMEVCGDLGASYNGWWEELGYILWSEGYADVCATTELLSLYEPADVRATVFQSTGDYPTYFWTNKYPGKGDVNRRDNNIPMFRLSEMYLIRAEADLKGASTGSSALADINMIRQNRGATDLVSANMTDLMNERRMELCFEGHIFFDYKRLQITLTRPNEEGVLLGGALSLASGDFHFALPISDNEMSVNDNMVQNPGY